MKTKTIAPEKIKILTSPLAPDGTPWHRHSQWAENLTARGLADIRKIEANQPIESIMQAVEWADVVFMRFTTQRMNELIRYIKVKYPNKPVVFDDDDDAHHVDVYNKAYRDWGTIGAKVGEKVMWQQGVAGFDVYRNRKTLVDYDGCLEMADVVTCTTERLREQFSYYNDVTVVIPNAITPEMYPIVEHKPVKQINLVWFGGYSHYADIHLVKNDLKALMEKNPQVHLFMVGMGSEFDGLLKDLPQSRVHTYEWVNYRAHGYRLATLNAHIGLAPLELSEFNCMKSCLKWYEYSTLGIPTVASAVPPYVDEIQNLETGLLAGGQYLGFEEQVQKLIDDPILRATLARNAREWVMTNRHIDSIADRWLELFEGLKQASKENDETKDSQASKT